MNTKQRDDWRAKTRPVRPFDPNATQPARRVRRPPARRPVRPPRHAYPRPVRRRTHRWGCLRWALLLILIVGAAGALTYGSLVVSGPMNVLVLGIDRRPHEGDAVRTDTMLLLHADPGNGRLVMMSIPRDLWVTIPGHGEQRINAAHVYGELESPGNGPRRAAETVTYNLGVPVDHTLRLDFDAFRAVIDAAGGIDIDVPAPMVDDAYPTDDYGTMRITFAAGRQHMDGERALQYARSRHGTSDFDRAARQQQIFVALAEKLSTPGGLVRAPAVYSAFQNAVETDMRLHDLARLALAWQRAGQNGVAHIVIDQDMTTPFRTDTGASVLLPRWDLIAPLVQAQFNR